MAYLLRSGNAASGEYVALASAISIGTADTFEIECNIKALSADRIRLFGRIGTFESRAFIDFGLNPNVEFLGPTQNLLFTTTGLDPLEENIYRFVRDAGNNLELFVNGVSQGVQSYGQGLLIEVLLTQSSDSQSRTGTDLKYFSVTINGVLAHYYDPDLSGGTGLVLTDSAGGNNGTLTGYAGDGSQWIVYAGDPSLTVTQATLTPGGTISGTTANYATAPTVLTVSDGTNTISSAGVSPQITGLTITPGATGVYDWSATIEELPGIAAFDAQANYQIGASFYYDGVPYEVIATQSQPNATPPNATYYAVTSWPTESMILFTDNAIVELS